MPLDPSKKKGSAMIYNVLFDLDGTLIDSNDAHAESWVKAFKEFKMDYPFEQIRPLIGMGSDQLLPRLTGLAPEDPLCEKLSKKRGEIFQSQYLKSLKPFPGARALVEKILVSDLKIAIASSASKEDLKGILKQIGITDLIQHSTSSDDADKSKPSPDIITAALETIKASPQETVMIGDTPYDIQAAAKAGVMTLAFTCGGWGPENLSDAIAVYEGPWDLLQSFESSALKGHLRKQISLSAEHFKGLLAE